MRRTVLACLLTVAGVAGVAPAQDPNVQPPTKPLEYWRAAQYELSVGRYDLAAEYLRALLARNPTPQDYLAIVDDRGVNNDLPVGISRLLALRNVPRWYNDPTLKEDDRKAREADTRLAVETLIKQATQSLKSELGNEERINRFIRNLSDAPEQRDFAIRELQRSGPLAMEKLIEQVRQNGTNTPVVLQTLPLLLEDTVPPLLAALDLPDSVARAQLLDALANRRDVLTLSNRAETDPTPTLVYLSALPDLSAADGRPMQTQAVRNAAARLLARIRPVAASRFPQPKVELTAAADRYYRHQATFGNPQATPVWYLAGTKLTSVTATASQAEEYFGLRYARWALELDPGYEPAQVIFLSTAVDKAFERAGLEKPLAVSTPAVNDLLGTASPAALTAGLERALAEKRTPVILGFVQALDQRAESTAGRPGRTGAGPLVRALDYPDRRVKLAAATALLHLPGRPQHNAEARIIEALRQALAEGDPGALSSKPRAVLAHSNAALANRQAIAIAAAGYQPPEVFGTGLELLRRLKFAADVDAVFVDARIAYPELPDLLASLRYDRQIGGLPVYVLTDLLPEVPNDVRRDQRQIVDGRLDTELRQLPDLVAGRVYAVVRPDIKRPPFDVVLNQRINDLTERKRARPAAITLQLPLNLPPEYRRQLEAQTAGRLRDLLGGLVPAILRVLQTEGKSENSLLDQYIALVTELTFREEVDAVAARLARPTATGFDGRPQVLDYDAQVNRPVWVTRVRRLTEGYRNVRVIDGPLDVAQANDERKAAETGPNDRPLTKAEKQDHRARALRELKRIALGEIPGYDIRPASDAVRQALADDALAPDAIETAGRLGGRDVQLALANVALDGNRKPALRALAAENVVRHVRAFGNALAPKQVENFNAVLVQPDLDPLVRSRVSAVIGAVQGGTVPTVERMRDYRPALPAAAPAVEKKDEEK